MSLDTEPFEDDITSRIAAICPRVVVTEVPDGQPTPAYPYVVVRWITPVRMGRGHHVGNSRQDAMRAGCIITVVSIDDDSARRVFNRIRNDLAGHTPPDCGEIHLEGGSAFSISNTNPKPTTYARESYCSWVTNLSWTD